MPVQIASEENKAQEGKLVAIEENTLASSTVEGRNERLFDLTESEAPVRRGLALPSSSATRPPFFVERVAASTNHDDFGVLLFVCCNSHFVDSETRNL